MTITTAKKGVWALNETYRKVLAGYWQYAGQPTGELYVWGNNGQGGLGLNDSIKRSSPVQLPGTEWVDICSGFGGVTVFGIKCDTTLWAWGGNNNGTFGNGTTTPSSSPVQIPGTGWLCVRGGNSHTMALTNSGGLQTWGYNGSRLGDGTCTPSNNPVTVPGSQWNDIAGSNDTSMARKTDGTLWVWGGNFAGALGFVTGPYSNRQASPVQLPGTQWSDIAGGYGHAVARKTDGTLWGWGCGYCGRLGNGTNTDVTSPSQVPGTQWNDIKSGYRGVMARKTDGTLWGWGQNTYGSIGNNSAGGSVNSPVQVPGTQWNDIAAGGRTTMARKTDGTLWSWGCNGSGTVGDNTLIHRSSPVQIPGTNWISISSGGANSFAIKCTIL
jgi:alpha-tubulin suppressor-like RCC1 family protein